MEIPSKDRFDQLLDSALQQYGNVQPRTGLESRILASIETQSRSVRRRRWILSLASIAGVCAITGALLHLGNESKPSVGTEISSHQFPMLKATGNPPNVASAFPPIKKSAPPGKRQFLKLSAGSKSTRHLQHFPSPLPLTEQELALAKYAESFPKEAELIAQEQQTFDEQMQKAQQDLRNQTELSDQGR